METFVKDTCKCGIQNLIYTGDPTDLTGPDYDGFYCWSCGKPNWFEEFAGDWFANGKPVPEDEIRPLKAEIEAAHIAADECIQRYRKVDGYPAATLEWRVSQLCIQIENLKHRLKVEKEKNRE